MHQSHQSPARSGAGLQVLSRTERQLRLSAPLRLAPGVAGWLRVQQGEVWLTRSGDPADHVLRSGQALQLGRGDVVVAESWQAGRAAVLGWTSGLSAPAQCYGVPRSAGATPAQARRRGLAAALADGLGLAAWSAALGAGLAWLGLVRRRAD